MGVVEGLGNRRNDFCRLPVGQRAAAGLRRHWCHDRRGADQRWGLRALALAQLLLAARRTHGGGDPARHGPATPRGLRRKAGRRFCASTKQAASSGNIQPKWRAMSGRCPTATCFISLILTFASSDPFLEVILTFCPSPRPKIPASAGDTSTRPPGPISLSAGEWVDSEPE